MRFVGVVLCCASCSFTPPDANVRTVTLVDDTEAHFAAHAQLDDGVATSWGTLEPDAFVIAGLHARAFEGNHVDDDDTFEDVAGKVTAQRGAAYRQVFADHGGSARPRGLGLESSDQYTLLYDGEILLPVGLQQLEVVADDAAIVQIAQDGVTFGPPLFARGGPSTMTLDVRTPGWFPIRIAYGQGGGNARLLLAIVQGVNRLPVDATALRARVTDHAGLIVFGFDGQTLAFPRGETAVPTIDGTFDASPPTYDLDLALDRFSLRHVGQLRIDQPATYTFGADLGSDEDDRYRLWIDDTLVATTWSGTTATPVGSIELAPGWHDIVFDYTDTLGNAQFKLLMDDAAIDPARLRPAVARGLVATHVRLAETALVDAGEMQHELDLIAPALGVIDTVDYGFGIKNHRMTDLAVELIDCEGAQALPATTDNPLIPTFYYFAVDARCAGDALTPSPAWQFRFVDSAPGNDGILGPAFFDPLLVASYHGGERTPFARTIVFVSAPKPTPGALRLSAARITAVTDGAQIELAVRTAPDEATLAATPWAVVGTSSSLPPASELAQYQLVITTDGWQFPSVDKVELEYVTLEP
jgi:hypothetical protein